MRRRLYAINSGAFQSNIGSQGDLLMKRMKWLFACALLLAANGLAIAQDAKPESRTVAQVLDRGVTGVENEFVPAVGAMPEDKFSFAPSSGEFKGVRTFAQQVKHVAAVNYMVG